MHDLQSEERRLWLIKNAYCYLVPPCGYVIVLCLKNAIVMFSNKVKSLKFNQLRSTEVY